MRLQIEPLEPDCASAAAKMPRDGRPPPAVPKSRFSPPRCAMMPMASRQLPPGQPPLDIYEMPYFHGR
jgi:hypothetical protein